MNSDFLSLLLAFALLAALRDACVLTGIAHTRPRLTILAGWPVLALLVGGEAADRLPPAQTMGLLRPVPVWAGCLAVHALLAGWLMRQAPDRPRPLLSLWSGPVFMAFAVGFPAVLLQHAPLPNGLLAGVAAVVVYGLLVGLFAVLFRLRRPSAGRMQDLLAGSHLSALLLVPFAGTTGLTMNSLHDLLYVLSNAFLLPTLLGTLVAFAYGVWVVGRFLADRAEHRHNAAAIARLMQGEPEQTRFLELPLRGDWRRLQRAVAQHADFPAMIDKTVADLEHLMQGRVERLGIMAKVGPMLGLVGTLIPLQPALAGLAKGDMQAMASNLQIGFTTTVLGLLVGGACYAVSVVMRGWYQQDLADMSFLLALWLPEENGAPGTRDSGESSRLTPVRLESK